VALASDPASSIRSRYLPAAFVSCVAPRAHPRRPPVQHININLNLRANGTAQLQIFVTETRKNSQSINQGHTVKVTGLTVPVLISSLLAIVTVSDISLPVGPFSRGWNRIGRARQDGLRAPASPKQLTVFSSRLRQGFWRHPLCTLTEY
jgi:hypothetical protein